MIEIIIIIFVLSPLMLRNPNKAYQTVRLSYKLK